MTSISARTAAPATVAATARQNDPSDFPPGPVKVPRTGWRAGVGITGLSIAGIGLAGAGVTLLRASGPGARVQLPAMLAFLGATLLGGATAGGSRLIGPSTERALAAGIPTRERAELVDRSIPGDTKIVQATDGSFAILRDVKPTRTYNGGSSRRDDDDDRRSSPTRSSGSSSSSSSSGYPSSSSGRTSSGDDSGSSRNSTSNGNPSYGDF